MKGAKGRIEMKKLSLIFNVELVNDIQIPMNIELTKKEFDFLSESGSHFISINDKNININDSFFSKKSIVNDETRYKIHVKNNEITKEKVNGNLEKKIKTLILLLESPHNSEYTVIDKVLSPIGPAQGEGKSEAGGAIEEYIINVLKNIALVDGEYYLIVVNPIQFQTSLNAIHGQGLNEFTKGIRNLVWRNLWEKKEIRLNFNERLECYKPIRIIDACTKELQPYVNFELILNKYKNITYTTTHPAINWNKFKENIKVEKLR